jgi:hypothetical protein
MDYENRVVRHGGVEEDPLIESPVTCRRGIWIIETGLSVMGALKRG